MQVREGGDLGYLGVKKACYRLDFVVTFYRKGSGERGCRRGVIFRLGSSLRAGLLVGRGLWVKHVNSRTRKFLICGGELRNCLKNYDVMTDAVCGSVNFRILRALAV